MTKAETQPLMAGAMATAVSADSACENNDDAATPPSGISTSAGAGTGAGRNSPSSRASLVTLATLATLAFVAVAAAFIFSGSGGGGGASLGAGAGRHRSGRLDREREAAREGFARSTTGTATTSDSSPHAATTGKSARLGRQAAGLWEQIMRGFSKRHEEDVEAGMRFKGIEDFDNVPEGEKAMADAGAGDGRNRARRKEEKRRIREAQEQARVAARVEERRTEHALTHTEEHIEERRFERARAHAEERIQRRTGHHMYADAALGVDDAARTPGVAPPDATAATVNTPPPTRTTMTTTTVAAAAAAAADEARAIQATEPEDAAADEEAEEDEALDKMVEAAMGAAEREQRGGAGRATTSAATTTPTTERTRRSVDAHASPPVFRNRFGVIQGLLEHVRARDGLRRERETTAPSEALADANPEGASAAADMEKSDDDDDGDGDGGNGGGGGVGGYEYDRLRYVTYANAAYWPIAKVLVASVARHAPAVLPRLTVMLTHRPDVEECEALSAATSPRGVDCFYDADMVDVLGDFANDEGSLERAGVTVPVEKHAAAEKLGKALRIVWCWRKVHAVYSLVKGGYSAVFLDASTVVLKDPSRTIARHFGVASLVTLSDFGGKTEQKSINTGLVAAPPGETTEELLEEWMKLEDGATETEQAYLTWDLAPRLRQEGVVIYALPQRNFPSYLTFDGRHVKGSGSGGAARKKTSAAAAAAVAGRDGAGGADGVAGGGAGESDPGGGASAGVPAVDAVTAGDAGFAVHAAYCGSVKGKLAFLTRVAAMARSPGTLMPPHADELEGCDTYDRDMYLKCGNAPWDGSC